MPGKNRINSHVRRAHWYKLVKREMEDLGISEWEVRAATGRGHPRLFFNHNGEEKSIAVPGTPAPRTPQTYVIKALHRAIEQ